MKKIILAASICAACTSLSATADISDNHNPKRASSHAPIGVMGDHRHAKGEYMVSYRLMRMDMQGNRIGNNRVSSLDITGSMMAPGQFMVAPTKMPMTMHMVGVMAGISDSITVTAMGSFIDNEMDHQLRNGNTFTTESSGIGDLKLGAIIGVWQRDEVSLHINLGLSVPTGSITERDDTPAQANAFLPYPMQLGSGTYDLLPGVTLLARGRQNVSFGAQASGTIRLDESDQGYTLGDRFSLSSWVARDLTEQLSVSARLNWQDWDNISGRNSLLNPMMIQTANTNLQAGTRLDLSIGVNYLFESGHRLAVEYARPVDQDLDGPQLETDGVYTLGWQKAF